MDRQAEIAPYQTSFVLSTQFPCPPSVKRGSMPSPRRSSLPPLPPKRPTTTRQQTELQYFNPGPRLPQSPVSGTWTPMSPAPSSSSFGDFQSAPVAYHNAALPPLPPFTRPPNNSAGLPYMDAMEMIYPNPIDMPVGGNYSMEDGLGGQESAGEPASFMDDYMELDNIFDYSNKDDDVARISGSSENNRRNAYGVVPSRRMRKRSVLDCNNLNYWSSCIGIPNGVFTESQMNEIARSEKLIKQAVTNPKNVKRILSNREASRRTHGRREQYISDLEKKVHTLMKEVATRTAHTSYAERTKLGLKEENKQIRIRIQEVEEQVELGYALTEHYNREINRLKQKGTVEVIPNWETTMDDLLVQLNQDLDEEPETKHYGFE